jgi:hypothetical protein
MGRVTALLLLGLIPGPAPVERRCNIPVFRYALERWHASTYEVIVFHDGPLTGEARAAVDALRAETANIEVDHVDWGRDQPPRYRRLWEAQGSPSLPWIVALFPGTDLVAWKAAASAAAARELLDSPARRDLSRRLLAGDSAVWIFLESGVKEEDDAMEASLKKGLRGVEKALRLPVHRDDDPPLLSPIPMKIEFSVLRVSRTDRSEKALVEMLSRADPKASGGALYPVFGRGRALSAISRADLKTSVVEDSGKFIAGPCACEVKELNPGVDLLLSVDWEQLLLLAAGPPAPVIPDPVIAPGRAVPPETPPAPPPASRRPLLWAASAALALLVLWTGSRALRRG